MSALLKLSLTFLKIGLIFVGGGYVLVPLLHRITVDQLQLLSLQEFLDGVALSQLTPGPLAMLATFTGFKAAGFAGGLLATLFLFLPSTLLMFLLSNGYERFRKMEVMSAFLDGILPAVVGLVAAAAWKLGSTSLTSARDLALLLAGILVLQFSRISPMLLLLGAGCLGWLLNFS